MKIQSVLLVLVMASCQSATDQARTRMRPVFRDSRLLAEGIKSNLSTPELRVLRAKVAADLSESCSEPSLGVLSKGARGGLRERCASYEKVAGAYSLLVDHRALSDSITACVEARPSTLPHYTATLADLDKLGKSLDCLKAEPDYVIEGLARREHQLGFARSEGKSLEDFAASTLARAESLFWAK